MTVATTHAMASMCLLPKIPAFLRCADYMVYGRFLVAGDADDADVIGYVTCAFYTPRLQANIAFAMVPVAQASNGTALTVRKPGDGTVATEVVPTPFYDPGKAIPRQ